MMNTKQIKRLYMDAMYYHLLREGCGKVHAKIEVRRKFYA